MRKFTPTASRDGRWFLGWKILNYTVLGVGALLLASWHTLIFHVTFPQHPLIPASQTVATFALAGLCFARARATAGAPINVPLFGVLLATYSLPMSFLVTRVDPHADASIFAALLAGAGAMLGATVAKKLPSCSSP